MKHRDVRPRGGERQTPAQRKIEESRFPPRFQNDCAQTCAAQSFACGTQSVFDMRGAEQKNALGIGTKFEQTQRRNLSGFEACKILPDPEQRFFLCRFQRKRERKSRCRSFVAGCRGIDLVQGAALKPALERRIGRPMA